MSKAKNRELFNEAIADAKAIKDMAIENAKKAIAESFTPQIHQMLATKLEEMEQEELEETETVESTNESEIDEAKKKAEKEESEEEEESTNENVNLDELLAELNEDETNEEEALNEDLDEAKKDDKKDEPKAKKDEEEEEEEIDLESMSPEDLEDFIKGVIKDMTTSGELEGGSEGEAEEDEDEDVTIDEIMKSLGESEEVKEGGSTYKPVDKKAVDAKSVEYYEKAHEKVKEELEEAVSTINEMKKTLNDVNLLNAKLLYTNKIFKAKNLNESQKVKVLNSFDKAKSVSESKVVYNLLMESLGEKKTPIKEHRSTASAVISGANKGTKKPILENVDPQVSRFMKLAGL
jgi:hypothetical protein